MKATDLARAASLQQMLEALENELRNINIASFDIVTVIASEDDPSGQWTQAASAYNCNPVELQHAARNAVLSLKRQAIARVKSELQSIGVVFEEQKALPAPEEMKEAA